MFSISGWAERYKKRAVKGFLAIFKVFAQLIYFVTVGF
jgi:hypothetical protein